MLVHFYLFFILPALNLEIFLVSCMSSYNSKGTERVYGDKQQEMLKVSVYVKG